MADYRAAIQEVVTTNASVLGQLPTTCLVDESGGNLTKAADPLEVALIIGKIGYASKPAVDRAAIAWNAMKAAQGKAFAGDPAASAAAADIDALRGVIESYGLVNMKLEDTGDLYAACNSLSTWQVANDSLQQDSITFVNAGTDNLRLTAAIQMGFQATQDVCKLVRVREQIPPAQMKGKATTRAVGGAALVYPKVLTMGKKAVRLPVNVTSTVSGYGTISVTRGSKGIVATGGWMEPGTFGLLMTVPRATKSGKLAITFTTESGPTVKGFVRLR